MPGMFDEELCTEIMQLNGHSVRKRGIGDILPCKLLKMKKRIAHRHCELLFVCLAWILNMYLSHHKTKVAIFPF